MPFLSLQTSSCRHNTYKMDNVHFILIFLMGKSDSGPLLYNKIREKRYGFETMGKIGYGEPRC